MSLKVEKQIIQVEQKGKIEKKNLQTLKDMSDNRE